MKLICEVNEDLQYVTEAAEEGKKNYFIEGIFMQGDIKNRNGRCIQLRLLLKKSIATIVNL